ncbi:ABC transporter transmembrane domain-containing protein [Elstera cyanobacteriorum]|uniref:ABC transporter transmembrane domain-containing protein n=1 Tax=Elstera cyanobacteriorum TaxID=2022747 RepID=UPI00235376D3|nr:ABC transporter transmembrane domain-containing protein [Elstera cyanobacteriorum]MCK6443666.1 ATP-binding cassette domain-containing protein [Elstera cyanobacteriorum]
MRQPRSFPAASNDERARSRSLSSLGFLLTYLKPYRSQMVGAGLALIVAASTVLALGSGLRHLVDQGFVSGNAGLLDQAVLVLMAVVALLAGATFARFYLVSWLGERVVADIRRDVFARALRLDATFYDTARTAEIQSRLTTDTAIIEGVVGSSFSIALRNFLLFIGGSVMLLITSAKLTGLVFLVVPLVVVPIIVIGRRVRALSRVAQDEVAAVGVQISEALQGVRTVQAFTHEAMEQRQFEGRIQTAFNAARQRIKARAWLTAIVILLVFGAISIILWIGGRDVLTGALSPGDLSAFVFYAAVVAGAVGAISEVIGDLQRAAGASERLIELATIVPAIQAPAQPVSLGQPVRGAVRFDGVSFRYPTRPDRVALDAVSFAVAPGERVALVGPSGAGKTTVFQLVLRFYDPASGTIRFDDQPLTALDPADLRGAMAIVAQEPVIFAGTVAENIRYGRPDASDGDLRAAAEAAFALEFIEKLPQGFDTPLGERGMRLSGGQRQRLAIARAILRQPALLLLDEATSALDAESERAVQQALDGLMQGRTTLVIAHRLATIVGCDRILVMDQGRIVESGTHDALVAQGGLYAHLAALQFGAADSA